jgi:hypothetical protein
VILLEFAAQGIRGVAPAGGRATLRPGYNVVASEGPALRWLLESLLYPDAREAEPLPAIASGGANGTTRAGLTLVGDDRITYRLVRDFGAGTQLHRFDPEKRSFALVSQDLGEIAAFLQRTAGVPTAQRLSALLALSAAELPSKHAGGLGGGAPAALAPARAGHTPEQARKRLAQLAAELEKARIAEKVQFQLDGLQTKAFKLEEVLRGGAQIREGIAKAEAARAELEPVAAAAAALGEAAEARIVAYEKATFRRDEALARVAVEREALDAADAQGAGGPLWRVPLFWAGVAAGLALLVAGAAGGAVSPGLRYLMLLDIPAFGWSAWTALRWIGALEGRERSERRRRVVDEWEKKVEAQYARDAAEVRGALQVLGVAKVSELREALGRLADADAVVAEWRRRFAEWEATPEASGARTEKAKVEEQQRALEARMSAEVGGFVREVRSIEMEIHRIEAEAAAPGPAAPAPRPAAPAPLATEPLRGLLERAAAELGGSASGAGRAIASKASQAIAGLSFQRLTAVQVDDRGGLHAVTGGHPSSAMTLPLADRDLVYVALKLALIEQTLQGGKQVAVLEDAFGGLSEGARRFAARLLKGLARSGQIVHATGDPVFREAADHCA